MSGPPVPPVSASSPPWLSPLITLRHALAPSGVAFGLLAPLFASAAVPFSATTVLPALVSWPDTLFAFFPSRRRKFPWGTVYDSFTKEPLDPAYVQLFDSSGNEVTSAVTDLDGRFGFLVEPGEYRLTAGKSHYQFPSRHLAGRTEDILFSNLYFGGMLTKGQEDAITYNIPMDPLEPDWNQVQKRARHLTRYVTRLDPYVLYVCELLFFGGLAFALWQVVVAPTFLSEALCALYALLLVVRLFAGQPPLYGTLTTKDGTPLSFAVIRFFNDAGFEVAAKVTDAYGRYFALVPPGRYRMSVAKRTGEEELVKVYEGTVGAPRGIINASVLVLGG